MVNREDVAIVAIVAIFGVVALIIYLAWKTSQPTATVATQSRLKSAVDSAVEAVHSSPTKHDYTFSEKLAITSPSAGTFSRKRIVVPMTGDLHKVTVRPTAADDDDYFKLRAGNRTLIDILYTYGGSAAAHEFEKDEFLRRGTVLTLEYYNAGTTSKDVDITFHMII